MRRFWKSYTSLISLLIYLLPLICAAHGAVLCIGKDGHYGVEFNHHAGHAVGEVSAPSNVNNDMNEGVFILDQSNECLDLSLVDLNGEPVFFQRKMADNQAPSRSVPIQALGDFLKSDTHSQSKISGNISQSWVCPYKQAILSSLSSIILLI